MKCRLFILFFFLITTLLTYSQDIIIKGNGDEISAKVLEVGLELIKYKKFDNVNGPTFEILKSEVFMIRYANGTKDVFNEIQNETSYKPSKKPNKKNNQLAFTENHKSTSLFYGVSALFGLSAFSSGVDGSSASIKSYAIGPVSLIGNRAVSNKISLHYGPAIMYYTLRTQQTYNYWNGSYNSSYLSEASLNFIFIAATAGANYHFATTTKVDPYVGVSGGVGYFFSFGDGDWSDVGSARGNVPLVYGLKLGLNVMNKSQNAWTFEFGYDYLSYLKIGYTFVNKK
jgi:hypothetical protein